MEQDSRLAYVPVVYLGLPIFVDILKLIEQGIYENLSATSKDHYITQLLSIHKQLSIFFKSYHLAKAEVVNQKIKKSVEDLLASSNMTAITDAKREKVEQHFIDLKKEVYQFMEVAFVDGSP